MFSHIKPKQWIGENVFLVPWLIPSKKPSFIPLNLTITERTIITFVRPNNQIDQFLVSVYYIQCLVCAQNTQIQILQYHSKHTQNRTFVVSIRDYCNTMHTIDLKRNSKRKSGVTKKKPQKNIHRRIYRTHDKIKCLLDISHVVIVVFFFGTNDIFSWCC